MAVEKARGCGYRKVGGLYLMTEGEGFSCERMPIPIEPCECCGLVPVKRARGWQWITWEWLDKVAKPCTCEGITKHFAVCALCNGQLIGEQLGVIWIGPKFYETPQDWFDEAKEMGISRRISSIPRGFKIGETWVAAAHAKAIEYVEEVEGDLESLETKFKPGIVQLFRPSKIELIVTPSMKKEDWVKKAVKKGVTLVEVPEDDRDHMPVRRYKTNRQKAIEKYAVEKEG